MPENRKLLLLGAGGHCRSVLDSLLVLSTYHEIGLVDNNYTEISEAEAGLNSQNILLKCRYMGGDITLERLFSEGFSDAFITVGSIGNVSVRKKLYAKLKQIGFRIPNIFDKSCIVSEFSILGEGIYVGKNAVINANTQIGNCAIVNTSSVIEHDCIIGDFVHTASGSILCGNVQVDDGAHIGAGSVVRQGIHIGEDTVIGLGSVVVKDIASKTVAYGNPCKEVEHE